MAEPPSSEIPRPIEPTTEGPATLRANYANVRMSLICGSCGYDLRATPARRCPECGRRFDPAHTVANLIPWEQRAYLGLARAYVRTALLTIFRPWQIAAKADRPINLADARRFPRAGIVVAALSLAGCGLAMRSAMQKYFGSEDRSSDEWSKLFTNGWSLGILVVGMTIGLWILTRWTAAAFGPRSMPDPQRGRARAIGHYAAGAALLWTPVAAGILSLVMQQPPSSHADWRDERWPDLLDAVGPQLLKLLLPPLVAWFWSTGYLMRATGHSRRRVAMTLAALPIAGATVMAAVPLLLEAIVAFVVLVVFSQR